MASSTESEELSRMQSLGVISPVKEPTPWCAGMVVVPKKSGAVCICMEFYPSAGFGRYHSQSSHLLYTFSVHTKLSYVKHSL